MAYRMVTCPETAHLEMIEVDPSPLGLLVRACSRFRPPCAAACARTCAARLDRKERESIDTVEILLADLADDDDTAVDLAPAAATSPRARW